MTSKRKLKDFGIFDAIIFISILIYEFRNETKNQHTTATESLNQTIDSLNKQIETLTQENKILQDRCLKAEREAGNLEYLFC